MKKNLIIIFILAVVGFGIVLYALGRTVTSYTPEKRETTTARIGNARITLEFAITPAERIRGLSGRLELPSQSGLLFVFPYADRYGFWMKDMNFPIDIIWIGADKRVVAINARVSPDSYPTTFNSPSPVPYVLEVNAGFSALHGIQEGDELIIDGGWPR